MGITTEQLMGITLEQIWNCEQEFSPGIDKGIEAQALKVGEEYGEVCDALLRRDAEDLKAEMADLLNTVFGLSILVYKNPDEMANRIVNAIHKMAEKYSE